MRCAIPALLLVVTACGHHSAARSELDDATVIDCVSSWDAGDVHIKLWADHADYAPDAGTVWRGKDDDRGTDMRYRVAGDHLRLWIDYGREVKDIPFRLVLTEETAYVKNYALVLDEPLFGHSRYKGYLAKSYQCKPRERAR